MCVRDVRRWGGDGACVCVMLLLLLRRRTCGTLHNNDAAELDHGTSPTSSQSVGSIAARSPTTSP